MSDYKSDILETKNVVNGIRSKNYGKIYLHSNELLPGIVPKLKLEGKRVLTVLGSGDQFFHFCNGGAKKVDAIDINKLAKHHLYLRKWLIEYMNQYYPDNGINSSLLVSLLSKVKPETEDEAESYYYWLDYAKEFNDRNMDDLYNSEDNFSVNRISNVSSLKDRLANVEFKFYNQDLFGDLLIDGKYDVIFTSNIADYVAPTRENFEKYRDNLDSLLSENGIIISSNVLRSKPTRIEKEVFEEMFDSASFPVVDSDYIDCSPATVYMRKSSMKK